MPAGRICRLLGFAAIVSFLIIAFTPLPNRVGGWLYTPPRLGPAGAIVVLGGPESEHRAIQGILLYRQGLAPVLVFSGLPPEVQTRETLARDLGLPPDVILTEGTVRTTREEAVKVGALLRARGIRRILLVTDALGMRRARAVFERAGFEVLPVPSTGPGDLMGPPQDQVEFALTIAEETVAYLYYRLMGYL
jgi:uncharacterized SAM-binding protein YcdF (DUF218 family)